MFLGTHTMRTQKLTQMKRLFFALIALVAISAGAQNGVTNPYRFGQGEDSIRSIISPHMNVPVSN